MSKVKYESCNLCKTKMVTKNNEKIKKEITQ